MANLNKVMIIGNLTRDPEVRYTPKGTAVSDISLAVNRQMGGQDGGERKEETTYIDVTLWGRQAELAGQYLSKGRPLFVEGRLTMDSWEDKQSGQKRTKLKVVGENMQFLGNASGQQQRPQQGSYQNAPSEQAPSRAPQNNYGGGASGASPAAPSFEPEEDDDIPF